MYIDASNTSTNYSYSLNTAQGLAVSNQKSSSSGVSTNPTVNAKTGNAAVSVGTGLSATPDDKVINMLTGTQAAAKGSITDDANLVVAFTDNDGKYTLRGVPVDNQQIDIRATLDTAFTVSGDKQPADIKQGKATTISI